MIIKKLILKDGWDQYTFLIKFCHDLSLVILAEDLVNINMGLKKSLNKRN